MLSLPLRFPSPLSSSPPWPVPQVPEQEQPPAPVPSPPPAPVQTHKRRKLAIADCGYAGESSEHFSDRLDIVRFVIYDFAAATSPSPRPNPGPPIRDHPQQLKQHRPGKNGRPPIVSPNLRAHGHEWKIVVLPGGLRSSVGDDATCVACCLARPRRGSRTEHPSTLAARFDIRCGGSRGNPPAGATPVSPARGGSYGWRNLGAREDVLDHCLQENGSLVIEVGIRMAASETKAAPRRQPPASAFVSESFLVEQYHRASETGDVVLILDDGKDQCHAHRLVLSSRAGALYSMVGDCETNRNPSGQAAQQQTTRVPIRGIRGETVRTFLRCIYTVEAPDDVLSRDEDTARELLLAARRFGAPDLGLRAESFLAERFLGPHNAASLLALGEANSCPSLKEACTKVFCDRPLEVMGSRGWPAVVESRSLLVELLAAQAGLPPAVAPNDSACVPRGGAAG